MRFGSTAGKVQAEVLQNLRVRLGRTAGPPPRLFDLPGQASYDMTFSPSQMGVCRPLLLHEVIVWT